MFVAAVRAILGDRAVDVSAAGRATASSDVFDTTDPVAAVVTARSTEDVVAIVQAAGAVGLHVIPRGGGASYTGGYLSRRPAEAVVLDMTAMDRIVAISAEDMYVVVEAGCTWARLHQALAAKGRRAAYWGPLSGLRATVGGAIGQNAILWGAGDAGSAADTVLGLEVVTGTGAVVRTGSFGIAGGSPFFRHFGPDLTGLFTTDAGALGIKTRVVLKLVPAPAAVAALSFVAPDHRALAGLLSEISRQGIAATTMGLDRRLKAARMANDGLRADLAHLLRLVRGASSLPRGLADAVRTIRAGRGVLDGGAFSAHLFVEGGDAAEVAAKVRRARLIAARAGATEAEASVPKMMQATPFAPLNGLLGAGGERWVPVHCIVPHSRAADAYDAIEAVLARHRDAITAHGITTGYLFTTVARNGFVIEPMFLWPDALNPRHHALLDPARIARFPGSADAPAARAAVAAIRGDITGAVDALGAVHLQLGRFYPYRTRLTPPTAALLAAMRGLIDPQGVLNPDVLR